MDNHSQDIEMTSGASLLLFDTPVLFLIFSRPETTKQVFEAIRKARPTRLYVAADGPRDGVADDQYRCEQSRKIATGVDWDCEVHVLFREKNFGCGKGPCTAISWFFEHETEGIILEDDCVPSPSFFPYCAELLNRYRDDTRIMHIAGTNLEKPCLRAKQYSYSFSNFTYCWGWATWRRAWKFNDFNMTLFKEISNKKFLEGHYNSIYERDYFQYVFAKAYNGDRQNVWDYQWQFACRINSGLVIVPRCNLIVNIGLGGQATNTIHASGIGHQLKLEEIDCPLNHPEFVMVNKRKEGEMFAMNLTSHRSRLRSVIKQMIPESLLRKIKISLGLIFTESKTETMQHDSSFRY
ncbi:MAG: nucleotide-diphospho-sugar transferase [Cyclobacteriaceae bacterium]